MAFGDAIDQHVTAVAHVLYGDLRGDVINDLAQEGLVAVAFLLEPAPFGDILEGRHPAALRQGLVDDLEPASVR